MIDSDILSSLRVKFPDLYKGVAEGTLTMAQALALVRDRLLRESDPRFYNSVKDVWLIEEGREEK